MSSSRSQQTPPARPQRPELTPSDTKRSGAQRPRAAFTTCALALAGSSVACAAYDKIGPVEAMGRAISTPVLESAIAMDKARLKELISQPGEEFSISFTQSDELNEIAMRLPAFQSALRARERTPGEKTRR